MSLRFDRTQRGVSQGKHKIHTAHIFPWPPLFVWFLNVAKHVLNSVYWVYTPTERRRPNPAHNSEDHSTQEL